MNNSNYFLNKTDFNTTIKKVWFDRVCVRNKKFTKTEITTMMKDSINNFFKQEGHKYGFNTSIKPASCPQEIKEAFFKSYEEAKALSDININTPNYFYSVELNIVSIFLSNLK